MISEYYRCWDKGVEFRRAEINLIQKLYASFSAQQGQDLREFALKRHLKPDVLNRLITIAASYRKNSTADLGNEMSRIVEEFKKCTDPIDV